MDGVQEREHAAYGMGAEPWLQVQRKLNALLSSANTDTGPLCDLGPLKAGQQELNSA